jgi:arsenite methyltransferase
VEARRDSDAALLWLTRQRDAGRTEHDQSNANATLEHIRDHVVAGAQLGPGHRVLDLGAGTGLITAAAAATVGPTGQVLALDPSAGALQQIDVTKLAGPVGRVVADAHHLPIAAASLDAVCARSVLIYLADLPRAVAELGRVLRVGGRLSVFEPVNRHRALDATLSGLTAAELTAIEAVRRRTSAAAPAMMAFDETALMAAIRAGGFTDVCVRHDVYRERFTDEAEIKAHLQRQPHPGARSPLAAIEQHLGADVAARYAAAWRQALHDHPRRELVLTTPLLYVTAVRGMAGPVA